MQRSFSDKSRDRKLKLERRKIKPCNDSNLEGPEITSLSKNKQN